MKYILLVIATLMMNSCGDQIILEKKENSAYTVDNLTVQIYDNNAKDLKQDLYLALFRVGSIHVLVNNIQRDEIQDSTYTKEFEKVFDEIAAIGEHWIQEGHVYAVNESKEEKAVQSASGASVVRMVDIDLSKIDGPSRSVRIVTSKANAEKLQAGLLERMKPYIKQP